MTEPTAPPPGSAGVSCDPGVRLEALRLAVKTVENAPYFPGQHGGYTSIRAAADDEGGAVLVLAERYRVFLEGGA